jgi:hypothetical protein
MHRSEGEKVLRQGNNFSCSVGPTWPVLASALSSTMQMGQTLASDTLNSRISWGAKHPETPHVSIQYQQRVMQHWDLHFRSKMLGRYICEDSSALSVSAVVLQSLLVTSDLKN